MATLIGSLLVTLGLESGAFKSGLDVSRKELRRAEKDMARIGKDMAGLGQKMSLAVTVPLVALGTASVQAAMESREAIGQMEASLASMGDAAGRSSAQLQAVASGIMRKSLYDDDEILRKVTANLLTFGNVSGTVFDRAQQAAVDLSAKLGQDLQSSTIMLGKALNDPVKGLTALTRVGVSFTEQQQAQIKAMAEAGDLMGAQKLLLAEVERQFAGSAEAMRKANPFAAIKQDWADFQETVGEQLLKILPNILTVVERMTSAFAGLSPGMQQAVVTGGLLAAALGPVLMGLGAIIQVAAPFLGALSVIAGQGGLLMAASAGFAGLAAALGPILVPLAAVAAAGALIYANWGKIGPVLSEFWNAAQAALGPAFSEMVAAISGVLTELWNGPLGEMVRIAGQVLADFITWQVKAFGGPFLTLVKGALQIVTGFFQNVGDAIRGVSALLRGDWSAAFEAAWAIANRVFMGIPNMAAQMVTQLREWLVTKMDQIWQWVTGKIEDVKQAFFGLYDAVVGNSYIPDMVDGIAAHMARLDAVMVQPAIGATDAVGKAFADQAAGVEDTSARIAESVSRMVQNLAGSLDQFVRGIKSGGVLDIIQGLFGMIGSIGNIITGGKGFKLGPFGFPGSEGGAGGIPGFASGGAMKLGGFAGLDRNLLALNGMPIARVSAGETMRISPANDTGGTVRVMVEASPYFDARVDQRVGNVVAQATPGIVGGARKASLDAMHRMNDRRLA